MDFIFAKTNTFETFLLVAAVLFIPNPIQAQSAERQAENIDGSASLQGSVRDSTGKALAGVTVYLQGKEHAQTASAQTEPSGRYRFSRLSAGVYVVRAELAGYGAAAFGPTVLGSTESKTVDLTLEPAPAAHPQASAIEPQSGKPESAVPEFFDQPQFTVAGVTDGNNLGGHGSNTVVRTKDALAKDIASLSVPQNGQPPDHPLPKSSLPIDPIEKSLRAEAEHQPQNFDVNHQAGKLLVDHGKADEALSYLERAAQIKPANYENAYLLALAYAGAGQYQRARTQTLGLLACEDKTQKNQSDLHHLLGDIEEKSGNPLQAVREFQRAAELDPSESDLFDWGAELLLHRAEGPAIEVFSKGNQLFPHSARMLVGLGVAWYNDGSYDLAAQRLCDASDMNPGDPNPYLFLGKLQSVEVTQSECSTDRLRRFAQLQPENALARYYYAVNLWKRRSGPGDQDTSQKVESNLKRAVQLDPSLALAHLQLGILYSERKDFADAISSYQDAIKASPQLEEALYRLAQAYQRTGEKAKAEQELQLYNQITKTKEGEVERERRESRQFVYTLRNPDPTSPSQ